MPTPYSQQQGLLSRPTNATRLVQICLGPFLSPRHGSNSSRGSDEPAVYLISGGGVHRTGDVDLQTVDYATTQPDEVVASLVPIDEPTVSVHVIGAGRFPHVNPPPDAQWAAGVRVTWEAFCSSATTRSCTVRDVAMTEEG